MASRVLSEQTRVRTERGQYFPTLGGSGANVTHYITLSNPGVSLDRMELNVNGFLYTGTNLGTYSAGSFGNNLGAVLYAYLLNTSTIAIVINEHSTNTGTSYNGICWQVRRW